MLHLSSERLAELADGEPTVAEAEHLAACAICAAERSAHQTTAVLAGDERDRIAPPLTEWSTLSAKLREQRHHRRRLRGARRPSRRASSPSRGRVPHRRAWLAGLRVAAGLVFAAGFGALGRMSAGASRRAVQQGGGDAGEPDRPRLGRTGHAVGVRRSELAVLVRRGRARHARDVAAQATIAPWRS